MNNSKVYLASYGQVYNVARGVSGIGEGNGPMLSYHEGFCGLTQWAGFMTNADRLALDLHPYLCFGGQSSKSIDTYANTPCTSWGSEMNDSMSAFGMTAAGEFSNAVTDCGKWLNGVNLGTRYEGTYNDGNTWPSQGSCDPWIDYQSWSADVKQGTKQFALASMDALQVRFSSHIEEASMLITNIRIGSSGPGRLEILRCLASSNPLTGHIRSDYRRAGCPWILVIALASVGILIPAKALCNHGKLEAMVLVSRSLPAPSSGHPLRSATEDFSPLYLPTLPQERSLLSPPQP